MPQVSATLAAPNTPAPSLPASPAARADLALLDLDVTRLRVPKVGRTKKVTNRTVPVIVIGPDGVELEWLTRTLTFLRHSGLAVDTCASYAKSFYRAAVVMWALALDPQRLSAVQWAVVQGWLTQGMRRVANLDQDAARPLAASTVAGTQSALHTLYEAASSLGLTVTNPVADLRAKPSVVGGTPFYDTAWGGPGRHSRTTVRVPAKKIKVVTPDMEERLRSARRPRDRALWTLCLDTGPRISEALSITPATYHPGDHLAEVVAKGRDGATREIPVSDDAIEAIGCYLSHMERLGWRPAPTDPIFRSIKSPYPTLTRDGAWAALRRATGDKNIHPHALRHTAATNMLALLDDPEGRGLITVQNMLGHANVSTTQKYLHQETARSVHTIVTALNTPRDRHTAGLDRFYGPEHIALLEAIWKEAQ